MMVMCAFLEAKKNGKLSETYLFRSRSDVILIFGFYYGVSKPFGKDNNKSKREELVLLHLNTFVFFLQLFICNKPL